MDEELIYTKEELNELGQLMAYELLEKVKNDPMKLYVLTEVIEGLERGDDVNDDLVELFKNIMMNVLIDGTIELDKE